MGFSVGCVEGLNQGSSVVLVGVPSDDPNGSNSGSASAWILFSCLATPYCISTINSTGLYARIGSEGVPSLSLGSFSLTANGLPPDEFGVFFFGPRQKLRVRSLMTSVA